LNFWIFHLELIQGGNSRWEFKVEIQGGKFKVGIQGGKFKVGPGGWPLVCS
jgi:hypothetical protein